VDIPYNIQEEGIAKIYFIPEEGKSGSACSIYRKRLGNQHQRVKGQEYKGKPKEARKIISCSHTGTKKK
jgi:hypothetical protein